MRSKHHCHRLPVTGIVLRPVKFAGAVQTSPRQSI
ncbi:hypothetical protein X801_04288 [Opisthorchis viverrini]|uniref:Uncharacterized protein n=1 Tax=Opisthorchis viverrini TaxID=6198 RepID=A0A1S8WZD0_OPIVI|nr:hypothetical protein X801_04288 [Opisthorchis viverrini]